MEDKCQVIWGRIVKWCGRLTPNQEVLGSNPIASCHKVDRPTSILEQHPQPLTSAMRMNDMHLILVVESVCQVTKQRVHTMLSLISCW